MSEQLILVRTPAELKALETYLTDKEFVSFDIETTGLTEDHEVIGFSVCAEVDKAFYCILAYYHKDSNSLKYTEINDLASDFLKTLKNHRLIMHNAIFDCSMINARYRIDLMPSLHTDTMILAHLLNENRLVGLKELGTAIYGESAKKEQEEMKASVSANGGSLTKGNYELYKADADLIGLYGAKDAILTLKVFYHLVEDLYAQGLDTFFYDDESMPLLKGPTYELNTIGLKVDGDKLAKLKQELEAEILETKAYIYQEITPHVKDLYPGTGKTNTFNINAAKQLAWLLFVKLGNEFNTLTDGGRELCKALSLPVPYTRKARLDFIRVVKEHHGRIYAEGAYNPKTKKMSRPKKVADWWHYVACGKETLSKVAPRYKWAQKMIDHNKATKLLSTYVLGIQDKVRYGIIKPSFLQHGTTSGRYSSRNPNFQNLPREDKRIKACIVSRPGKVFVGADYSQLEPRVFASVSQDETLMGCFAKGEDFYSVVGAPIFEKTGCSMYKKDADSFATLHPKLRDIAKQFALATPYGTSPWQQSMKLGLPVEECERIMERYFEAYPRVEMMMLERHETVKAEGVVYSLYGRPRRIPEAKNIAKIYGKNTPRQELPRAAKTMLNLAMNHTVQSSAASIVNRAMIGFYNLIKESGISDCATVMQVHDEVIVECLEADAPLVRDILKAAMETTTELPGVKLEAEPKIAFNLKDLK